MTKIDKIEQVLLAGKKVTPLSAIQICGAMRLAALIFDLKKRGHKIITTIKQDTAGNDYAEYRLKVGPEKPEAPAVPELKAGDKVRLSGRTHGGSFPEGAVCTVERIDPSDSALDLSCEGYAYTQWYAKADVVLVDG